MRTQNTEPSWRLNLSAFHDVIRDAVSKEGGDLRFKSRFVKVSDIAGQYYCEKKVELATIQGEEESPEMKLGREAHEGLLEDTIKVKREALWSEIFAGKPMVVREMLLAGKHNSTIIVGVADAVFFYQARPLALFEYKFSRRPSPFHDHHVQARLYCHLLKLMGFDVSNLKYALVMASPESKGSHDLRSIPSHVIKHLNEQVLTLGLESGEAHIYLAPYQESETTEEIEWALGFWRKQRDATATKMAGKCRVCQFRDTCEFSLAKAN